VHASSAVDSIDDAKASAAKPSVTDATLTRAAQRKNDDVIDEPVAIDADELAKVRAMVGTNLE
jgi:hypothetical protein